MKTPPIAAAFVAALAATMAAGAPARAASGARLTMEQAKATALEARPGQITDAELEKEKGGSGLRYSFDIASGGKTFEVGVDAQTGAILENAAEAAARR